MRNLIRLAPWRRMVLGVLTLFALACEPPQTFKDDDMGRKYPSIAQPPAHGVPVVAVLVPRNGGWSGDNQLGYQAKYGPDRRQTQTILKLDEWGPPEMWTISLNVLGEFTNFDGFGIKARINFGSGGSTQVYECDWLNGTQVSLPMNAVNVEAIFEDVEVNIEGKGLSVGVQLSRGARGGTRPPVLTIVEDLIIDPASSTLNFQIPKFAKKLVMVNTSGVLPIISNFYSDDTMLQTKSGNSGGGAHNTGSTTGAHATGSVIELPIIGQARLAQIFNSDVAVPIQVSLYAELDG